ncbi:MAG: outer membrane beta-barrel protein [Terricaulis sp.]
MLIRALKRLLQQPGAEAPQPKSASPIWRRVCATVLAVISAWGISCDQTAWAQQEEGFVRNRSESVRGRAKPEYEAPGVSAGSFRFFPEVSLIEEYSDNVFATDTVEEEDFITALEARGRFASNWSSNALNIDVGAQSRFYSEFDDENTTDWSIGADGRIDILRELFVTGVLTFEDTHEARADQPTADLTTEPVQYTTSGARLGIVRRLNRVQVSGNASYTTFDYDDTPLVGGGALEQDDRDPGGYRAGRPRRLCAQPGCGFVCIAYGQLARV